MTDRTYLQLAFVERAGWSEAKAVVIAGDASNRRYMRLTRQGGETAILMDAPPDKGEDVTPFIQIAQHLTAQNLSAPRIFAQDRDHGFLLIEDLGDDLFARLMRQDPARELPLYTAAVDVLRVLHRAPTTQLPVCDADWLTSMTDTVFDFYVSAPDAMAEFKGLFYPMAQTLNAAPRVVILRDYHAENLLWLPDREGVAQVGLLDFQDALLGHPAYDLVSVLQDARRDASAGIETAMIDHYLARSDIAPEAFRSAYALIGVQRNLRILGIFARLCLRDGKPQYVDMIPRVWGYVRRNLAHPDLAPLRAFIDKTLPEPTPEFLNTLRSQCASPPFQP